MRASRIFAFARTSRCASVGVGNRKARAISAVPRPPEGLQRQRNPRLAIQRRVTAGEGQPEQRVRDRRLQLEIDRRWLGGGTIMLPAEGAGGVLVSPPSAQSVDRVPARRGGDPGYGGGGHARAGPVLERLRERVMQRLLGEIEVAEDADQRGEDATRLLAEDPLHGLQGQVHAKREARGPRSRGPQRTPGPQASMSHTGRTSTQPYLAEGI